MGGMKRKVDILLFTPQSKQQGRIKVCFSDFDFYPKVLI